MNLNPEPLDLTPCASCGCPLALHSHEVGADWQWGPGACLECSDCDQYQAPAVEAGTPAREA